MSTDVLLLVLTAFLAVVAVGAAIVAVTAARRTGGTTKPPSASTAPEQLPRPAVLVPHDGRPEPVDRPDHPATTPHPAMAARAVAGRVVVPPSERQVVNTALGRPQVRLAILVRGLAHALRPEARDRIGAMMRREYRRRRSVRLRAGRQAVRAALPTRATEWTDQSWIGQARVGELPVGPGPSSADRVEP